MLVDHYIMSDLEPGFIGLAIRVRCQLSGDLFWLWGNPQGRRKEYPPPSCYLYDNSSPPMLILSTLRRLCAAGVIDPEQFFSIAQEVYVAERQIIAYHRQKANSKRKQPE